jgi:hypothetical protein
MPNQNYLITCSINKSNSKCSGNWRNDQATFLEKVMNQLGLSGNASGGSTTTDASQLTSGTLPDARLSTNVAFKNDVNTAIANLVNSSPAALDTLNELATALGNDPNFATTITNALAGKVNATDIVNALTQVATGKVLDASQGKVLNDLITALQGTVTANTKNITSTLTKPSTRLGSLGNRRIAGFGSRPAFVGTGAVSDGVQTQETSRFHYKAIGNMFDLSVVYINSPASINNSAITTTGDITITASLEYPSGTFTQITFNNNNISCVLKRGQKILSDSLLLDIPDGADYWIRTCVTVTSGVIYPKFWSTSSSYSEGVTAGSDVTMSGTIANSTANTFMCICCIR